MSYFSKGRIFNALTGTMFGLLVLSGCKEVDNTLGLGFVPEDQKMKIKDTILFDPVLTYMSFADSIPYSNQGLFYLGSTNDPIFGKSTGSGMLQYYPTSFGKEDEVGYFGFGNNPVADSMKLVLFVQSHAGKDASVEQKFNVYPMSTLMKVDSTYYNVNMNGLYDPSPLFTFTIKDVTQSTTLMVDLDPTPAGYQYMQDLVDVPKPSYSDTATYRNQFKGLYIAPASDSPIDANIFTILLYSDDTWLISSGLKMFAHNYDANTGSLQDTIVHDYHFTDKRIKFNQLSLAKMDRDYTGTPLDRAIMKYTEFDSIPPTDAVIQSKLYFQSASGVFPYMYVTDELLAALQDLKLQYGTNYDLLINEAVIRFPLVDPTIEKMDAAPKRLGMYHKYKGSFANILDYDYYNERYNEIVLPYGGKLDRHFEYYSMNISSYLTRLLRENEDDQIKPNKLQQRTIALGSDFYSMMLLQYQVELAGKGFDPQKQIELKLIYTLIPKLK